MPPVLGAVDTRHCQPCVQSFVSVSLVSTPRLIKTSGVAFHQVAQIPPLRKVKCEPLCHVSKFSLLEQTRSLADAESGTELSVTQVLLGRSRTVEKSAGCPKGLGSCLLLWSPDFVTQTSTPPFQS